MIVTVIAPGVLELDFEHAALLLAGDRCVAYRVRGIYYATTEQSPACSAVWVGTAVLVQVPQRFCDLYLQSVTLPEERP